MTTTLTPARPAPAPRAAWWPRSGTAWAVLVTGGLLAACPAFLAAALAGFAFTGCFIGCGEPEPVLGAFLAGVAALLLALPFAAVRFVQGARTGEARQVRLLVLGLAVLGAVLLVAGPAATRL
jgi:hypothetical protein